MVLLEGKAAGWQSIKRERVSVSQLFASALLHVSETKAWLSGWFQGVFSAAEYTGLDHVGCLLQEAQFSANKDLSRGLRQSAFSVGLWWRAGSWKQAWFKWAWVHEQSRIARTLCNQQNVQCRDINRPGSCKQFHTGLVLNSPIEYSVCLKLKTNVFARLGALDCKRRL